MRDTNEGDWQLIQWSDDDDAEKIRLVALLLSAIIWSRNIVQGEKWINGGGDQNDGDV